LAHRNLLREAPEAEGAGGNFVLGKWKMQMMNGETPMLVDRDDLDRGIETLSEEYPKAFFVVAKVVSH
jgi:hypothetical protein